MIHCINMKNNLQTYAIKVQDGDSGVEEDVFKLDMDKGLEQIRTKDQTSLRDFKAVSSIFRSSEMISIPSNCLNPSVQFLLKNSVRILKRTFLEKAIY